MAYTYSLPVINMNREQRKQIELHVKGATIQHKSQFENLQHYDNGLKLSQGFIDKWVKPFYMNSLGSDGDYINQLNNIKTDLNLSICKELLGDFNWRTRSTGANFAAINNYVELEDIIGIHLLKSQVCYAGTNYCFALASFNTKNSIYYLKSYLEYYLNKPSLYFDQSTAMAALYWLDNKNKTNHAKELLPLWESFTKNKDNWDLNNAIKNFNISMDNIELLKNNW